MQYEATKTTLNSLADLVSEIASGAQEQSIALGEINVGVTQLDKVTQQNAAMVEEGTASSETLKREAESLRQNVARFRLADRGDQGTGRADLLRVPAKAARPVPLKKTASAADSGWHDF